MAVKIVKYSEKSVAIFGDTKIIKEELKSIGSGFNRFLKNPDNQDEKLAGWILSIKRLETLTGLLSALNMNFSVKL